MGWIIGIMVAVTLAISSPPSIAKDYTVTQIADPKIVNRDPSISANGLAAWHGFELVDANSFGKDIYMYRDGQMENLSRGKTESRSANINPVVRGERIVWTASYTNLPSKSESDWMLKDVPVETADPDSPGKDLGGAMVLVNVREQTWEPIAQVRTNLDEAQIQMANNVRVESGNNEILSWDENSGLKRVTRDGRNDLAPDFDGDLFAWQKAKGWPFGWEIMIQNNGEIAQLTTNFYYDMGPRVDKTQITWYGWDGNDFEIYLHDVNREGITQITSNDYDDVAPVISEGNVAWMGYKKVEADIFLYDGTNITLISNNPDGDDINPSIHANNVVWQGFDGEDFEIYLYNGKMTVKLTDNLYDDSNPIIRDDTVVWMGYQDNWDPEIYTWLTKEQLMLQLTTNEVEDRAPQTAGGKIIWQTDDEAGSSIYLATPK